MRTSTRFAILPLVLIVGATAAPAQERDPRAEFLKSNSKVFAAFKEVTARPSQSTVRVRCDGKPAALGTIVAADGWILTKNSELKGKITCVVNDGRDFDAEVKGVSEPYDLAMLKVDARGLKPIEFRESKQDPVGNWVASVGVDDTPVAIGVVSVAARKVNAREYPPLIDTKGGYLGIALDQTEEGAKVKEVLRGTAADKAGIKVNDVILAVGAKTIKDPETLIATLSKFKPGDVVTLKVKRGDDDVEMKATLGKRPAQARGDFMNSLGSTLSEHRTGFPVILQHDTVLKPNECGGPLVDLDGKAIGINIARAGRTESYAIPAEEVLPLLADLKSGKLAVKEEAQPVKEPSAAEVKVQTAKAALKKAEAELAQAQAVLAQAKAAAEKAEAEKKAAEKRLAEAKAALEKAEADARADKKP
jgi:serine protease Do